MILHVGILADAGRPGAAMEIERIGDLTTGWGESLLWDEQRARLYLVDCATRELHWLEGGEGEVHTRLAPSMPAGLVAADDGRLVACLDDGLYVVDPDAGDWALLAAYPDGLGARANDACADGHGRLVTGTLNLAPAEGSAWSWSAADGWRLLDPDISNTNGPNALDIDGVASLIVGDTSAQYYAYPYDGATGTVGERRVFGDVSALDGNPDGAAVDADGGLWTALVGGGQLVRFTSAGVDRQVTIDGAPMVTDVAFGGPDLDRLYVVSVGTGPDDPRAGQLLCITGLATGRVEPRVALG